MRFYEGEVKTLLEKYPYFKDAQQGKLLCTITGHELPISQLSAYVTTNKKFLSAHGVHQILKQHANSFEDEGGPTLFCKVTGRRVARDPEDLKRCVNGKRYQQALQKAANGNGNRVAADPTADEKSSSSSSEDEEKDEEPVAPPPPKRRRAKNEH